MTQMITIAVFDSYQEIVVLKSILEDRDIAYFFENENSVTIHPFASYAYGGIKLKIHPEDAKAVQEILDDLNNNLKLYDPESCQHLLKTTKRKFKFKLIYDGYYSVLIVGISSYANPEFSTYD